MSGYTNILSFIIFLVYYFLSPIMDWHKQVVGSRFRILIPKEYQSIYGSPRRCYQGGVGSKVYVVLPQQALRNCFTCP